MAETSGWGKGMAVAVVVAVTAASTWWLVGRDRTPIIASDDIVLASALQPFDDCIELRDHFVEHALEMVGPWGLDGGFGPEMAATAEASGDDSAGAERAETNAAAPTADGGTSGTNVQEVGVDEADIVKANERMLATVTMEDRRLRLVDLTGDSPRKAGSLELPQSWQHELFLDGDRLLVLSSGSDVNFGPATSDVSDLRGSMPAGFGAPISSLTLVDVSDLDAPAVVSTLQVDGSHVSARMSDGVARLVLRSGPVGLAFLAPEGGGLRAERDAIEENRKIIEASTIDNWLPAYVLTDGDGEEVDSGRAVNCESVHRPDEFAGLGLTSVLSMDIADDVAPGEATAVITGSDTVYASTTSLYVATQTWINQDGFFAPEDTSTAIHRFALDADGAGYAGSGAVEGRLLNQWAMSEHEGHLRVATTSTMSGMTAEGTSDTAPQSSTATFIEPGGFGTTQSSVVVLRLADGGLPEVGRVDGLGVTEQIYAVRYMGDQGYVVTFRQTDPLYVIDLSDPTAPSVAGELKIPGFSSYLHPVGEGLLLGIGQDATEEGQTSGLQASLFDVSDPADPQRLTTLDLGVGYSPVEYDHRAFLYWDGLAVVPVERYEEEPIQPSESTSEREARPFNGAVVISVDGAELTNVAELSHADQNRPNEFWNPIQRAQVVDGQLLTVSPTSLGYGPIADLGQRDLVDLR